MIWGIARKANDERSSLVILMGFGIPSPKRLLLTFATGLHTRLPKASYRCWEMVYVQLEAQASRANLAACSAGSARHDEATYGA
jgi:hypothetical protein